MVTHRAPLAPESPHNVQRGRAGFLEEHVSLRTPVPGSKAFPELGTGLPFLRPLPAGLSLSGPGQDTCHVPPAQ